MATAKKAAALRMTTAEFEAQAVEALHEKPGITLELANGTEVYIAHPATVDDDRLADVERVQGQRDLDLEDYVDENGATKQRRIDKINGVDAEPFAVRFAKAILGPEDHAKLRAGGGKSAHVVMAWQYLTDKGEGDDPKPER